MAATRSTYAKKKGDVGCVDPPDKLQTQELTEPSLFCASENNVAVRDSSTAGEDAGFEGNNVGVSGGDGIAKDRVLLADYNDDVDCSDTENKNCDDCETESDLKDEDGDGKEELGVDNDNDPMQIEEDVNQAEGDNQECADDGEGGGNDSERGGGGGGVQSNRAAVAESGPSIGVRMSTLSAISLKYRSPLAISASVLPMFLPVCESDDEIIAVNLKVNFNKCLSPGRLYSMVNTVTGNAYNEKLDGMKNSFNSTNMDGLFYRMDDADVWDGTGLEPNKDVFLPLLSATTLRSKRVKYVNPFARDLKEEFDAWVEQYKSVLCRPITSLIDIIQFRVDFGLETIDSKAELGFHEAYLKTIIEFQKSHGWYIGMVEGFHRAYASLCVMTGSYLDCVSNPVLVPGTLTDELVVEALDPMQTKFDLDREEIDLLQLIENKISRPSSVMGSNLNVFPRISTGVKDPSTYSACSILEELNNESLAWQTDKKNSSYRPASVFIAEFFEFVYERVKAHPSWHEKIGAGKWKYYLYNQEKEPELFSEDFYESYLRSPSKDQFLRAAEKMKEPTMDMSSGAIALPYIISYGNMIDNAGAYPNVNRKTNSSVADAMEVNNFLCMPCIYEPIYKAFFCQDEFDEAGQKRLKFLLHHLARTVPEKCPTDEDAKKYDISTFDDRGECLDDMYAALFIMRALNACLSECWLFPVAISAFEQAEHAVYGESQMHIFTQYARMGKVLTETAEVVTKETRERGIERMKEQGPTSQSRDFCKAEIMSAILNLNMTKDFISCLWKFGLNPTLRFDGPVGADVSAFVRYAINKDERYKNHALETLQALTQKYKVNAGWKRKAFGARRVLDQSTHVGTCPTSLGLFITWYCFYIHKQAKRKREELIDLTYITRKNGDHHDFKNKRAAMYFEEENFDELQQLCLSTTHHHLLTLTGLATQIFEPRRKDDTPVTACYEPHMENWEPVAIDLVRFRAESKERAEAAARLREEKKEAKRKENAAKKGKKKAKATDSTGDGEQKEKTKTNRPVADETIDSHSDVPTEVERGNGNEIDATSVLGRSVVGFSIGGDTNTNYTEEAGEGESVKRQKKKSSPKKSNTDVLTSINKKAEAVFLHQVDSDNLSILGMAALRMFDLVESTKELQSDEFAEFTASFIYHKTAITGCLKKLFEKQGYGENFLIELHERVEPLKNMAKSIMKVSPEKFVPGNSEEEEARKGLKRKRVVDDGSVDFED